MQQELREADGLKGIGLHSLYSDPLAGLPDGQAPEASFQSSLAVLIEAPAAKGPGGTSE